MLPTQLEVIKQEAAADNISLKARLLYANRLELLHLADRFRFAPWHSSSPVVKKEPQSPRRPNYIYREVRSGINYSPRSQVAPCTSKRTQERLWVFLFFEPSSERDKSQIDDQIV